MTLLGAVLLAATPEPGDVVPQTPPEDLVTPGTIGFLATFFVAVALVLLVRDMNRRVRTVRVRAERADEQLRRQDAEARAQAEATGDGTGPTRTGEPLTRGDAPGEHREPPVPPNG